jgi:NAD(P)-dependent dehydrogenase (short-subunit alcohol dehydrogenase family)
MGNFDGKVGLVTGAGGGIGRESARLFAERGASVGVLDIQEDLAQETVDIIEQAGGKAVAVAVDVGDEASVKAAIDRVVGAFGALDFAHNNAGVTGVKALLHETDTEEWRRNLRINLDGVYFCMKYEIPHMLARGGGAICNTASMAGLNAVPGMPPYCAAKHGVVGLTKAAAVDYAPLGIRVNANCPGSTMTPMMAAYTKGTSGTDERAKAIPLGRLAEPVEQAYLAVWLCSDEASFVTGVAYQADGGRRA